jgi:glycosyltransferase involved in cell wall biosynthesis
MPNALHHSYGILSNMKRKHVLCVATHILGGRTFSRYIKALLDTRKDFTYDYVWFDKDTYKISVPPIYRISNSLESGYLAKALLKQKNIDFSNYDAVIFLSYHLAAPFKSQIKQIPTLISLDSTPILAHKGNVQANDNWKTRSKSVLAKFLGKFTFAGVFKNTDLFLTRTETVKNSLINDYNISGEICETTYIAIEQPSLTCKTEPPAKPQLLFVGNDFKRKGGDFILDVFREHLRGKATLVVVSSTADNYILSYEKDITLFKNISHDEVLKLMQSSDIFLFPTFKDEMGIAICEAISNALPVVARQTCSQHELVISGKNGFLMPFDSNKEQWAEAIKRIIASPELMENFSEHSKFLAHNKFSKHVFEEKVNKALDKLLKIIKN